MDSNEKVLLMQVRKMWLLDCGFERAATEEIIYVDSLDEFMQENKDRCMLIYADRDDESLLEQGLVVTVLDSGDSYRKMVPDVPLVVGEE